MNCADHHEFFEPNIGNSYEPTWQPTCAQNPPVLIGDAQLYLGDCLDILPTLPDASVHAIVTDPPYHLTSNRRGSHSVDDKGKTPHNRHRISDKGFMGKAWDGGTLGFNVELWRHCLRVLKPGGYLLAFGATRTQHRMVCAIEDAGFEIRDSILNVIAGDSRIQGFLDSLSEAQACAFEQCLADASPAGLAAWCFGNGFPKSKNLKGEFSGWGSALKPAFEPITMARKPLQGTLNSNVSVNGCGALNIAACRVSHAEDLRAGSGAGFSALHKHEGRIGEASRERRYATEGGTNCAATPAPRGGNREGRWPANVVHDGSTAVIALFPDTGVSAGGSRGAGGQHGIFGDIAAQPAVGSLGYGDNGSASRFFYVAKASRKDRNEGCESNPARPINWSSGDARPGSFQSVGTDKSSANNHPTVKPTALMRMLCRLVTPQQGVVLDVCMGSGSTGKAALLEGFRFIGIEREPDYFEIAKLRIEFARKTYRPSLFGAAETELQGEGLSLDAGMVATAKSTDRMS